ncbi:hypothetical protein [Parahalioglobus pacificus]|uniref:hypothetical protein n=1 Tax=Parahalioglobus pacificus TaxID=930806 RepID=UPI001E4151A8|nr:hypothetical protein [Halioglobus pacificus]
MIRHVMVIAAVGLVSACASKTPVAESSLSQCETPRPQVCTMIYAPVCATRDSGATAEYASACNACADDQVVAYVDGQCPQG